MNHGVRRVLTIPDIRVGQLRQVYDETNDRRWYVEMTDEFLNGRGLALRNGISINSNPHLNTANGTIFVEPLHQGEDFVVGDIYVDSPEFQLDEFPLDQQSHYGFVVPPLARNGGRTRRRKSKSKSKSKSQGTCKSKSKPKKTVKTRKFNRRRNVHK